LKRDRTRDAVLVGVCRTAILAGEHPREASRRQVGHDRHDHAGRLHGPNASRGDPEPFASLMADDSEWRGVSNGHLWWKYTPACHGPSEALETMKHQIKKRAENRLEVRPEFTQIGDDKIVGSTEWIGTDGRLKVRYQVLTFRDGKIVDMQGCSSRREAEQFARKH
jgi:ketosteroid isomerase-like protein